MREFLMQADVSASRKRPVNLTLNEAFVAQAKTYTNNLSATMEKSDLRSETGERMKSPPLPLA